METIYYRLDARRLTVYHMASGEAAPAPRDMLFLRTQPTAPRPEGKVLDFDACRRALAGEVEEEALPGSAGDGDISPAGQEAAPASSRARGARRLRLALDVAASLAVVVMAAVVVSQFLRLL